MGLKMINVECSRRNIIINRGQLASYLLLRAVLLVLVLSATQCSGLSSCPAGRNNATYPVCGGCPSGTYSDGISCPDCLAGSYSGINATACTPCAAGTFASASRSSACVSCSPGWYSGLGAKECMACPAGTYGSTTGGVATCTNCRGGTYSTATGSTSSATCVLCGAGQSSPSGSSRASNCTSCPAGTYGSSSGGVASCTNCVGGTYSGSVGATSSSVCTYCGPGTTSAAGSPSAASCALCPAGKYGDVSGVATCTSCPGGTYSGSVGATNNSVCLDCGAGNQSNAGSSTCAGCPAGSYGNTVGVAACTSCPAGTYNPSVKATNASACFNCAPGMKSAARAAVCTNCTAGTYAVLPGTSVCTNCAAGNYSTAVGAANVAVCYNPCPAGTYSNAGASSCTPCPRKTIAPNISSASCAPCPYGSYRSNGTFCFYSPTASFSVPQSATKTRTRSFVSPSVETSRSNTPTNELSAAVSHSTSIVASATRVATNTNTSSWSTTVGSRSPTSSNSRVTRTATNSNSSQKSGSLSTSHSVATITLIQSGTLALNETATTQRSPSATTTDTVTQELPLPPPPLSATAQASSNIAVIASTAIGGDPVSITQTAFATIVSCADRRPAPSKLTALTISLFYDSGPVAVAIGNVGLAIGITILHALWTYAVARWRRCPFFEAASGGVIRFPSHSIRIAALLLPGSVYGSVSLFSARHTSAAEWVVGVLMISVFVALFSVRQWALWKHLLPRCSWYSFADSGDVGIEPKKVPPQAAARATWIEQRLLFPSGRWIPIDLRNQFGSLFSASSQSRVHLFVVEQLLGLAAAACAAASLTSNATLCQTAVRAMAGLYFCTAIWIALARPYRFPVNWLLLPLVYFVFGVSCLLQSLSDGSYATAAAGLQSLASCLQIPRMSLVLWVDYREFRCFPEVMPTSAADAPHDQTSSNTSEVMCLGDFDLPATVLPTAAQPAEEDDDDVELEIMSSRISSSHSGNDEARMRSPTPDLPLREGSALYGADRSERLSPAVSVDLDEDYVANPLLQLHRGAVRNHSVLQTSS